MTKKLLFYYFTFLSASSVIAQEELSSFVASLPGIYSSTNDATIEEDLFPTMQMTEEGVEIVKEEIEKLFENSKEKESSLNRKSQFSREKIRQDSSDSSFTKIRPASISSISISPIPYISSQLTLVEDQTVGELSNDSDETTVSSLTTGSTSFYDTTLSLAKAKHELEKAKNANRSAVVRFDITLANWEKQRTYSLGTQELQLLQASCSLACNDYSRQLEITQLAHLTWLETWNHLQQIIAKDGVVNETLASAQEEASKKQFEYIKACQYLGGIEQHLAVTQNYYTHTWNYLCSQDYVIQSKNATDSLEQAQRAVNKTANKVDFWKAEVKRFFIAEKKKSLGSPLRGVDQGETNQMPWRTNEEASLMQNSSSLTNLTQVVVDESESLAREYSANPSVERSLEVTVETPYQQALQLNPSSSESAPYLIQSTPLQEVSSEQLPLEQTNLDRKEKVAARTKRKQKAKENALQEKRLDFYSNAEEYRVKAEEATKSALVAKEKMKGLTSKDAAPLLEEITDEQEEESVSPSLIENEFSIESSIPELHQAKNSVFKKAKKKSTQKGKKKKEKSFPIQNSTQFECVASVILPLSEKEKGIRKDAMITGTNTASRDQLAPVVRNQHNAWQDFSVFYKKLLSGWFFGCFLTYCLLPDTMSEIGATSVCHFFQDHPDSFPGQTTIAHLTGFSEENCFKVLEQGRYENVLKDIKARWLNEDHLVKSALTIHKQALSVAIPEEAIPLWDEAIAKVEMLQEDYLQFENDFLNIHDQIPEYLRTLKKRVMSDLEIAVNHKKAWMANLLLFKARKETSATLALADRAMKTTIAEKTLLLEKAIYQGEEAKKAWNSVLAAQRSGQKESLKQFQGDWGKNLQITEKETSLLEAKIHEWELQKSKLLEKIKG